MENATFKDELNHYKETIDIRDYLEKSGYSLDKSRDTPRYRAYTHQEFGDKVYVPKNSKGGMAYYYVNQFDNDDKGTLIDFVMSREKKTLDEARLTLRDFQHGYLPSKVQQPGTHEVAEDEANKKKRQQYMVRKIAKTYPSGLDDLYMEKRLLSAATRHHPAFVGKVKRNETSGERWIVFPLEDEHGKPTGLAMKREGQEKILGEKSGVWLSHPTLDSQAVDKIVITEHPIDAMSYHQLGEAKLHRQNVVYMATAGNPSAKQFALIQKKIEALEPKEIILANDNDQAGQQYNEKYQEQLKITGIPIRIEKPQFKDWNADVHAGVLYQVRLMDKTLTDPHRIQQEGRQKASPEMEDMILHKKYAGLSEQQKLMLPSCYVERNIEGKLVAFSLKEVALINKDQKLAAQLETSEPEKHINQSFVAEKTQQVQDQALLNRQDERAIQETESSGMPSGAQSLATEKRVLQIHSQSRKAVQAFQEAEVHIKDQPVIDPEPKPVARHPNDTETDTTNDFLTTQRTYNHRIDTLQQQIGSNPAYEQMSRKLSYYKNYPHLSDEEVDTYLSIEDKMRTTQQSQGMGRQKNREIEI